MKISRVVLLIAMVLYVASFFLTAVKESSASPGASGYTGYLCAYLTLLTPWGHDGMRMLREGPVDYFAILFSGWINPVFLITLVLLLRRPNRPVGAILRIVLLFMFVAPWIVFHKEHLYPVAGYFLWTAAMLLAIFSNQAGKARS